MDSRPADPGLGTPDSIVRVSVATFRADPPDAFRTVMMDGLSVAFHRPSGTTHILAPPAPDLLALLGQRPLTVADLAEALGVAGEEGVEALIAERLAELEEAGLVARA